MTAGFDAAVPEPITGPLCCVAMKKAAQNLAVPSRFYYRVMKDSPLREQRIT